MRCRLSTSAAVACLALASSAFAGQPAKREYDTHEYYVLDHNPSGLASYQEVAAALGAEVVEQVGELRDHWLLRVPKPSQSSSDFDPVIDAFHSIRKRAMSSPSSQHLKRDHLHARRLAKAVRSLERQVPRQRTKRWMNLDDHQLNGRADGDNGDSRLNHVMQALDIHDPEFHTQWHLLNLQTPPHDMNVTGVWEMGYTGKGVIAAIVDDGLDFHSDDLAANYWPRGSWDYNDHIPDPLPKLSDDQHGTRCAGEVAAGRNDVCGLGVAYDSKIAGLRILSGAISDADEAASLNYGFQETSIYSCSWGPPDDGRSMEAPSNLIQKAVLNGDPDWEKTSQGRPYSYKYGFGALNGYRFVSAAKTWPLVKPQAWIEMPQIEFNNASMTWDGVMSGGNFIPKEGLTSSMALTSDIMKQHNFEKLEHITVKVWISHMRRGDVEVYLTSPNGIKSILGGKRQYDADATGYPGWTFMTLKHWDENPIGNWTIHVSDQGNDQYNGSFLGWTMNFWGSVIDPTKAILYSERPRPDEDLPDPIFEDEPSSSSTTTTTTTTVAASTTKQYVKPTEHLPDDHDQADGESHNPAFPDHPATNGTSNPAASPSITITPDEGYFSHMGDLLSSSRWLYGGLALIVLFGAGAGVFFWRRRARRAEYQSVADDEMAMTSMLHGGRATDSRRPGAGGTRELYDAFGEVSDEDDDHHYADEETGMRRTGGTPTVRYHDGFLDDDAPESAAVSPAVPYRDDPTPQERARERRDRDGSDSGSGSGSGSWEDAQPSDNEAGRLVR
ncbi:pheromone processing endoprotease [Tulasnella sp. 427]|nr:pheromone processing endoprotease [Tulasnella sp. 427]